MKLENALAQLEGVRLDAEGGEVEKDILTAQVILILVEFINNDKIRSKVDEISF